MFKGLGDIANLVKQAQQMGGRLEGMAAELRAKRVTGSAGGGLLEIEMNGAFEVMACRIDPQLLAAPDREFLEDLVKSATNQAVEKARAAHAEAMNELTGGLTMPGLEGVLSRFLGNNPGG